MEENRKYLFRHIMYLTLWISQLRRVKHLMSTNVTMIWISSHLNEWPFSMYVRSDVCRYTYDVILHVIHDILHIMNAEIGLERSTLSFLLTY